MFTDWHRVNYIVSSSGGDNTSFITSRRANIKDVKRIIKEK
jgi:hypothetical protein